MSDDLRDELQSIIDAAHRMRHDAFTSEHARGSEQRGIVRMADVHAVTAAALHWAETIQTSWRERAMREGTDV
jgi:hypothetical protein